MRSISRMKKMIEMMAILTALFFFSFIFNFVWESFHAVYLYKGHDMNAVRYIPMLLYVSSVDGLLVDGLYVAVALIGMDLWWVKAFRWTRIWMFLAAGIFVAALIEYRAVYVLNRWSYTKSMPTIFGLGLSPLGQLSMTGFASLWLTKQLLFGKGVFRDDR